MGGSESNEFVAKTDAGEDLIASCANCGYAANLEKATSRLLPVKDLVGPEAPEEFPTPGVRTIEDLTTFPGGAPATNQIKTLVYVYGDSASADANFKWAMLLLRGDHQLHEIKLADTLGASFSRAAQPDEIVQLLGASPGSLGGVGAKQKIAQSRNGTEVRVIADLALKGRRDMTTGANKDDHHLRGIEVERDIQIDQWADLRSVNSGESCPRCDNGVLEVYKAMEIGHIFKLGTKYSESMGATVLTESGKPVPIVMGSYGIGVERIITAAIEQNHDADGIIWPKTIAPFDAIVTVTNMKDEKLRETGEKLYKDLIRAGLDTLLDDRDERAGVKFKDADLIGIPYRVTIGRKVSDGVVELFARATKTSEDVKLSEIVSRVQKLALAGL
jgi:prolyl-tRNA synthetase